MTFSNYYNISQAIEINNIEANNTDSTEYLHNKKSDKNNSNINLNNELESV